jgi:hypothetical protein
MREIAAPLGQSRCSNHARKREQMSYKVNLEEIEADGAVRGAGR